MAPVNHANSASADQAAVSPTRKLSPEELETVTKRLHDQQMEKKQAQEEKRKQTLEASTFKQAPLTEESKQQLVQRVYISQMEKKKRNEEQRLQAIEAARAPKKTLSETETSEMVQRMYYQQQQKAKASEENLKAKYQPPIESKKLDKETQAAVGTRLCTGVHEKKQEIRKKLFEKYIAPMEPEKKTIDKEKMKVMADRLCPKK